MLGALYSGDNSLLQEMSINHERSPVEGGRGEG